MLNQEKAGNPEATLNSKRLHVQLPKNPFAEILFAEKFPL
jgi:hypothetical protein